MEADNITDRAEILALLRAQCGGEVTNMQPLAGGEFSRASDFTVNGDNYVVRLSTFPHAAEAFAKDAYAWRHFATPALPIPRIVAYGQVADLYYAISERVAGDRLEVQSATTQRALQPALLDTLDAIAAANVQTTAGFGAWDAEGQGESASWQAFLARVIENRADGYYQDWHALFRTSFLERDLFTTVYQAMLRLLDYCPEERALLHCDLHTDNILTDGEHITGIVDWGNACYGDPLFDVAWLGRIHALGTSFVDPALLRARYGAADHYDQRLACYSCYLGLDDLRFYAKTGRRSLYASIRQQLLALIAARPD